MYGFVYTWWYWVWALRDGGGVFDQAAFLPLRTINIPVTHRARGVWVIIQRPCRSCWGTQSWLGCEFCTSVQGWDKDNINKKDSKSTLVKNYVNFHAYIDNLQHLCIYFPGTILFHINLFESTHTRHSDSQLVHSHGNISWPVWTFQTPVFGTLSYKLWHHTLSMAASHCTVSSGCTRLDRRSHGSLTQTQSYYTDGNLTESGHILKMLTNKKWSEIDKLNNLIICSATNTKYHSKVLKCTFFKEVSYAYQGWIDLIEYRV